MKKQKNSGKGKAQVTVTKLVNWTLSVIGLVLLILFLAVFFPIFFGGGPDQKQVRQSLADIKEAVQNARISGTVRHLVLAPADWFIVTIKTDTLKEFCTDGKCICICPPDTDLSNIPSCLKQKPQGICETSPGKITSTEGDDIQFQISPVPLALTLKYFKDTDTVVFYKADLLSVNEKSFIPSNAIDARKLIVAHGPWGQGLYPQGDLKYPEGQKSIVRKVLTTNEEASQILLTTNAPEIIFTKANAQGINPLFIAAILKEKYSIFTKFNENTLSAKVKAASDLKTEIFNHAQEILKKEDAKVCPEPTIIAQAQDPEAVINLYLEASVTCLAQTIQKANEEGGVDGSVGSPKYIRVKTNPNAYEVISQQKTFNTLDSAVTSWYTNDIAAAKKIGETFTLYSGGLQ